MNNNEIYRFVGSITEFNSIHDRSKMKFCYICSRCNKLVFVKGYESISRHPEELICKTCRLQEFNYSHPEVKTARANGIRSMTPDQKAHFVTAFKETWFNKSKEELDSILDKRKQTCRETLGVDFPSQSDSVKLKVKNKRDNKTEEEIAKIYDKVRQSWIEKSKEELKDIDNKKRKIKAENHNGDETYNNREKFKETWSNKSEKDKNLMVERVKLSKLKNYGRISGFTAKYDYYGIKFDSSWELAVWIYYIDHNIKIIREPIAFKYDNNEYIPDFWIEGIGYVEIKGDQFFDKNGNMINPYDESQNIIYEAKHQCGLQNNVKFWTSKDIQPYLKYCDLYHFEWKDIFRINRFVFWNTNCYINGINPYNLKIDDDNYCQLSDREITPFDNIFAI